jgi:carboxyl-terminal processing protease
MFRRLKWPLIVVVLSTAAFAFRSPAEKYFDIAKSLDIYARDRTAKARSKEYRRYA